MCITVKTETVFTLRISNGLGRSLGHISEVEADVFHPLSLKKTMFTCKVEVEKIFERLNHHRYSETGGGG